MKSLDDNVSWDDLRLAVATARTGSLSGAARRAGLSVATVGRRLDRLDRGLGLRLFHRHASGVLPSPEAEGLLARAAHIAEQIDDLVRLASAGSRVVEGVVTLTTLDTLITRIIAPRLPELRAAHPRLDLVLRSTGAIERLDHRRAEIAIRVKRPHEPRVVGRRLGAHRMAVYASQTYLARYGRPSHPDVDLRGHLVIGFDGFGEDQPEMAWLTERMHGERMAYRVTTVSAAEELVRQGAAIGVLPAMLGAPDLIELATTVPPREVWLVLNKDLRRAPAVRAVADFMAEVFLEALQGSEVATRRTNDST